MPIAPEPDRGPTFDQTPSDNYGGPPEQDHWGRNAPSSMPAPGQAAEPRRFGTGALIATGAASLVVGVVATSLAFTLVGALGSSDDAADNLASSPTSETLEDNLDDQFSGGGAQDDGQDGGMSDDVIGVGDGFTVTTWDGIEVDTYVHEFSVDEACKYGQPRWEPEKAAESRIVQLTIDVENLGDDRYFTDQLTALSDEGYTQPVESAYMYCNEPDDGANRWGGRDRIEPGEKKLLYGAFEVQPDADQLVLVSTGNGKILLDIPGTSGADDDSGEADGSPDPNTTAG
ncbi:hypothetical protein ACT3SZ_07695 [Corynebacterium sp. AOP40-9SA-29]|uniref:hypothetical protein n=1 Tax=Corynebacterium sp. AOP40-9SA-29 TaxID=3457677 RepID=UPI004033C964